MCAHQHGDLDSNIPQQTLWPCTYSFSLGVDHQQLERWASSVVGDNSNGLNNNYRAPIIIKFDRRTFNGGVLLTTLRKLRVSTPFTLTLIMM